MTVHMMCNVTIVRLRTRGPCGTVNLPEEVLRGSRSLMIGAHSNYPISPRRRRVHETADGNLRCLDRCIFVGKRSTSQCPLAILRRHLSPSWLLWRLARDHAAHRSIGKRGSPLLKRLHHRRCLCALSKRHHHRVVPDHARDASHAMHRPTSRTHQTFSHVPFVMRVTTAQTTPSRTTNSKHPRVPGTIRQGRPIGETATAPNNRSSLSSTLAAATNRVSQRTQSIESVTEVLTADERQNPASLLLPPYYADTPIIREDWKRNYELITAMDHWGG